MSRPSRFRRLRRTATVVSGVALLALLAGGVVVGEQWPAPATAELDPRDVAVPAGEVTQVCPGPPRLGTAVAGEDLGYDEFDPEGSGTDSRLDVVSLPRPDRAPARAHLADGVGEGGDEDGEDLTTDGDVRAAVLTPLGRPGVLSADPVDGVTALVAGTTTARTEDGDLRGLAAARCLTPGTSSWFVAGGTEPGGSAQLVLSNLGATAATVDLDVWGATGPLDTSALGSVLVAPHSQQVVLLEAATPEEPRLGLRVRASGGEVAAHLQDSELAGLVPGGTELLTPGAPPATEQLLPGVVLGEDTLDGSVLRVLNPGEEEAEVSVELLGADDAQEVPGAQDVAVDPGTVLDISLAGLPAGEWSVRVRGTEPVAASALLLRGPADGPTDRAWVSATPLLSDAGYVLPGRLAGGATLVVANASDDAQTVTVVPTGGDGTAREPVEMSLEAGRSGALDRGDLGGGDLLALEVAADGAGVHSGVLLIAAHGDFLSWLAPTPDPHADRSVPLVAGSVGLQ